MHCRQRWHQKKRKARRALRLHNRLTMAHTGREPDSPSPLTGFSPDAAAFNY